MKGLFYYRTHRDDPANQGVVQKCEAYAQAFQHSGVEADVVWYTDNGLIFNGKPLSGSFWKNRKKSVGHLLTFYISGDRLLARKVDFRQYDFLLIRHMPVHPAFLALLKKAKRDNPLLQIIVEMPTWPYDAEMKDFVSRSMLLVDRLFRTRLHGLVDRFLHYGQENAIWGVPTIFVQNGIDTSVVPKWVNRKRDDGKFRMLFIGSMGYWHGLDRLLHGLRNWIDTHAGASDIQPELTIAGSGAESEGIRTLVNKLDLGDRVRFVPPCKGEEFNALMAQADIGIGTLGIHRIGIALNSALKHRTYCAYGLPFVFAGNDADFPASYPFCLRAPEDESPVDVEAVLQYWKNLLKTQPDAGREIQTYAAAELDWKNKIKPVLAVARRL